MNPIELRTKIHIKLSDYYGLGYGDILTVEPISPVAGDPAVRLRVRTTDPNGEMRKLIVTIQEED